MHDTSFPDEDTRTCFWSRVRQFAVPPAMIETAAARRELGDWGGACAAAGFDPDIDVRAVSRSYGAELAGRLRSDLRHLAPDLLRWHLPRIAPDGLLRPGLTLTLARYPRDGDSATAEPLHLVVRTPPVTAAAGQRVRLALWEGESATARHPHPRPDRRFRLDLHRHLWDARRSPELAFRAINLTDSQFADAAWGFEADLLRTADGLPPDEPVAVRLAARRFLLLDPGAAPAAPDRTARTARGHPVLPDAATWTPPDVLLLAAGRITPERLHPLVAAALAPGHRTPRQPGPGADAGPLLVDCRGELHRLAVVDGVLVPLDHGAEQLRREDLLVALGGTPLPCLRALDRAHRQPEDLDAVRQRLLHGDRPAALAAVRRLLGEQAVLREGPLAEALRTDADRHLDRGLDANGLDPHHGRNGTSPVPVPVPSGPKPGGHPHRPRPPRSTPRRLDRPWRH
ncbi:hypothetical protein [Streptomyces sp. TLI_171]|uniref:hypothetical protein n=1 Tax=Streptomyces sp. TLI_171 TaxID=1938859 RepID=UPI000C190D74|nr:hypothetical protein [Streptomyces sp. TLI_171]RKE22950.1 hypothetical protein BX266_6406 [Streptomyces sp. TLI_171]